MHKQINLLTQVPISKVADGILELPQQEIINFIVNEIDFPIADAEFSELLILALFDALLPSMDCESLEEFKEKILEKF